MKSNYKQIAIALKAIEPFIGNSLRGERWGDEYRVISYRTLIATHNTTTGENWISPTRYSVTTTKQQNLIRRAWGVN
jgi:hypothetical protein